MRILIVEDTEDVAWPIRAKLERDGHAVDCALTAASAYDCLAVQDYDLIVLDINLPDGSGFDILRTLRDRGNSAAVLALTARSKVEDRVSALDLGADDYMVKPFDLRELQARVRALLRRSGGEASGQIEYGPLRYDQAQRKVTVHGEEIKLTPRELSLLEIFLMHTGKALSKEDIHAKLYCFDENSALNAVELYVGRLRRKLAGSGINIQTLWGVGYRVTLDEK
jgi:two-component system response regulator TctD